MNLSYIDKATFTDTVSVVYLLLNDNKITSLPDNIFAKIGAVNQAQKLSSPRIILSMVLYGLVHVVLSSRCAVC